MIRASSSATTRLRWLGLATALITATAAWAASAAACSAFGAAADPNASTVDGGLEGGAPNDSPGATNPEGGGQGDAGNDPDAWVACSKRAEDPAHFCADFDFAGKIETVGWNPTILKQNGGTFDESDASLSSPRALLMHLPASTAPPGRMQLLRLRPDALDAKVKSHMRLSFWVRVTAAPFKPGEGGPGYMHIAVLEFDNPSCATTSGQLQRDIEVTFTEPGNLSLFAKGLNDRCPAEDFMSQTASYGLDHFTSSPDFRHVTLDLSKNQPCQGNSGGSLTLTVDDAPGACLAVTADPFQHMTGLKFLLGLYGGGAPYGTTDVTYDNVTLDFD